MDHVDPARDLRALLRHTNRCPAGLMQGNKKPAPEMNPGAGSFCCRQRTESTTNKEDHHRGWQNQT